MIFETDWYSHRNIFSPISAFINFCNVNLKLFPDFIDNIYCNSKFRDGIFYQKLGISVHEIYEPITYHFMYFHNNTKNNFEVRAYIKHITIPNITDNVNALIIKSPINEYRPNKYVQFGFFRVQKTNKVEEVYRADILVREHNHVIQSTTVLDDKEIIIPKNLNNVRYIL